MTNIQSLKIFLPMCDNSSSNAVKTSMNVNIFKTARISDLIGLVCCKYVNEDLSPSLK